MDWRWLARWYGGRPLKLNELTVPIGKKDCYAAMWPIHYSLQSEARVHNMKCSKMGGSGAWDPVQESFMHPLITIEECSTRLQAFLCALHFTYFHVCPQMARVGSFPNLHWTRWVSFQHVQGPIKLSAPFTRGEENQIEGAWVEPRSSCSLSDLSNYQTMAPRPDLASVKMLTCKMWLCVTCGHSKEVLKTASRGFVNIVTVVLSHLESRYLDDVMLNLYLESLIV